MTDGSSLRTKKVEFLNSNSTAPLRLKASPHAPPPKPYPNVVPVIYPREMHSISRQNIDADALRIMRRLINAGYKAFLVGGGVRDLLLDKKPKDFDIATDATPREIKSLFRNCRIIGKRFKLAHIFFDANKIIEVSTFRDMHEAIVVEDAREHDRMIITQDNNYGDEMTDALRRDLTINGLFYDLSSFSIIDYVGGMKDLDNQIVRMIGDPSTRFAEDPARMIRVLRHSARSGFVIEPECLIALEEHNGLIKKCAPARIFDEFRKDLVSGFSLKIIALMQQHGLLDHILPELAEQSKLLKDSSSLLFQALSKIDAQSKLDNEHSSFTALCCIALFATIARQLSNDNKSTEEILSELPKLCSDRTVLEQSVSDSYRFLAVPRKEKDRICTMLKTWGDIEHAVSLGRKKTITNRYTVADLKAFFAIAPDALISEGCIASINKASSGSEHDETYRSDEPQRRDRHRNLRRSRTSLNDSSSEAQNDSRTFVGQEDSSSQTEHLEKVEALVSSEGETAAPKKRRRRNRGGRRKNQNRSPGVAG